jgi:hypothetical protein
MSKPLERYYEDVNIDEYKKVPAEELYNLFNKEGDLIRPAMQGKRFLIFLGKKKTRDPKDKHDSIMKDNIIIPLNNFVFATYYGQVGPNGHIQDGSKNEYEKTADQYESETERDRKIIVDHEN